MSPKTTLRILTVLAAALIAAPAAAQETTQIHPGKGGSPHVRSAWKIDGAAIVIEYGRPSIKGRAADALMPPGKPWRTGADEATIITTDRVLRFGQVTLQPGTYTINTQPGAEWQIIFGKLGKPGQWGVPYQAPLEIARAPMTVGAAKAPVEVLTISIDDTSAGGTLRIEWGSTSVTIPFTVG
jgi:nucleoid-associated protein YgaU